VVYYQCVGLEDLSEVKPPYMCRCSFVSKDGNKRSTHDS